MTVRQRRERKAAAIQGVYTEDVVQAPPAGSTIELAWASWEYPRELMAARRFALLALVLAAALCAVVWVLEPKVVFVDQATGERIAPSELVNGARRGGNTPADLAAALAAGREIAMLRFGQYAPETLNPALQAVYRRATVKGRAALDRSIPRRALAQMILGDSGWVTVREFGYGGYAYGASPGRVILILPLVARYWSVHAPFDGVKSGIAMGDTVELTLVKTAGRWWLDDIKGEILDPVTVATWTHYGISALPRPAVVIDNVVYTRSDSALLVGYRRGVAYVNQN